MRSCFLILSVLLSTVFSCTFKSDHPQADLIEGAVTGLNSAKISAFATYMNTNNSTFNKQYSLVYMLGDNSLYVEKFTDAKNNKVYYEHVNNGSASSMLNKYYFQNDSLVLVEISNRQNTSNSGTANADNNEEGSLFRDTRIFLRNNTLFKKESRTASSAVALGSLPYLAVNSDKQAEEEHYFEKIKVLDDAILQRNKFEMVFDNITTYPDSRFLTLKSKIQNSYTASILINQTNGFIDSLLHYPSVFKDESLNFKWNVKDNEAVYVPEASNTSTSASGLKR